MEKLLDTEHGVPALLASIAVILCLQLIVRVGEFAWGVMKKKNEVSEQGVEALAKAVNANTFELASLKQDLRRYFIGLKLVAGDRWPGISKIITDDEKTL